MKEKQPTIIRGSDITPEQHFALASGDARLALIWEQLRKRKKRIGDAVGFLLCMSFLVWMVSCGAIRKPVTHPGAINTFDSQAADALLEAQTTLCGLTPAGAKECIGGLNHDYATLVPGKQATVKPFLQKATDSYNALQRSYQVWRSLATHAPGDEAALNSQITSLVADVAAAVRSFQ